MFKMLVDAVGNRTVIIEGGEYFLDGGDNVIQPTHVEEGFLLTGEGCIR